MAIKNGDTLRVHYTGTLSATALFSILPANANP